MMQCKGQDYVMLQDTTCKPKSYYLKTYLALANVPMWHYGFKPCFLSTQNFRSMLRTHAASRKGPLDGAVDPPGFSAGMVDPAQFSRDVPVNLTLQLIKRELIRN